MADHTPISTAPAYELNQTQFPERTTHDNYLQNPAVVYENQYPHQSVSPLVSPAPQPQGMVSEKQEYHSPEQGPPQQQYSQQQQQQQQQIYQTAVPLANLQEAAAPVDCPVCRHRALTTVEKVSGNTVHLWAALTCLVFCLGCVPYLIPGLKDVQHKCGRCGVLLAVWHKSGRTVVLQHA